MFSNIKDRIRLLFRKDRESYLRFYKMLGFYPKDISIYEQALLHKSLSVKSEKGRLLNNERLEFLGMLFWMLWWQILFTKGLKESVRFSHEYPL